MLLSCLCYLLKVTGVHLFIYAMNFATCVKYIDNLVT